MVYFPSCFWEWSPTLNGWVRVFNFGSSGCQRHLVFFTINLSNVLFNCKSAKWCVSGTPLVCLLHYPRMICPWRWWLIFKVSVFKSTYCIVIVIICGVIVPTLGHNADIFTSNQLPGRSPEVIVALVFLELWESKQGKHLTSLINNNPDLTSHNLFVLWPFIYQHPASWSLQHQEHLRSFQA